MPRMPTAFFEDYEEPVAASDHGPRSSQGSPHRFDTTVTPTNAATPANTSAALPQSPRSPAGHREHGAAVSGTGPATPRTINFAEASLSSLRMNRVQRAEEYPRIAFKPRRELRNLQAEEAQHGARSGRGRLFVFGRGSHGLCDRCAGRGGAADGEDGTGFMKLSTTQSACPALPGVGKKSTTKGKEVARQAGVSTSPGQRLPQLSPSQMSPANTPATSTHTRRSPQMLSKATAQASTPRMLRYGGVIDTFSYFSIHRVHPELYSR